MNSNKVGKWLIIGFHDHLDDYRSQPGVEPNFCFFLTYKSRFRLQDSRTLAREEHLTSILTLALQCFERSQGSSVRKRDLHIASLTLQATFKFLRFELPFDWPVGPRLRCLGEVAEEEADLIEGAEEEVAGMRGIQTLSASQCIHRQNRVI